MDKVSKRTFLWMFLLGAYVLACAVDAPPPGGPVDEIAPVVIGTFPSSDSAGVDPGTEIGFTFSEGMSRARVERMLSLSPEIEIGQVRWDKNTIYIKPAQPLHPDTTYIVTMSPGFRDFHKVASKKGYQFAFATSAAIDSGTISGRVYFRREPTKNGVVRCFILPVDSGFNPEAIRPDRQAVTDDEGNYELKYLSTTHVSYVVWAFEDKNNNLTFAPGNESGTALEDTVVLTPESPHAGGLDIFIVDPDEPLTVAGVVINDSGLDTFEVSVALYADSLGAPPAYMVTCDTTGAYTLENVHAGLYLLRAFIDMNADSICGEYRCLDDSSLVCVEPCIQYPDSVVFEPGASVVLDTLRLQPPSGRKE
jgi:hypothetical protein